MTKYDTDNRSVVMVFRATPAEREALAEYADWYYQGNVSQALRSIVGYRLAEWKRDDIPADPDDS